MRNEYADSLRSGPSTTEPAGTSWSSHADILVAMVFSVVARANCKYQSLSTLCAAHMTSTNRRREW